MAFDNLGAFIEAGTKGGQASQSPFGYGAQNVMDMFKMQQENAMKLSQTAALFKGQKDYEFENSPANKEAQAKLEASGYGNGSSTTTSPPSSGGPPPPGSPFPGAAPTQGSLGTNVPTSFTSVTNQKFDNQKAEVSKNVIQKQLESSSADAAGAALMMQKMNELRNLHDKAMSSVDRAKVTPSPFGLATRGSQAMQATELAAQGPDNPDWQNYENAKTNFSQMADRGLFGEKGKLTGQQIKAGQLLFPGKSGTKEGDEGLWNILYSIPKNTIDFHNKLVTKTLGSDSAAGIQSNPIQSAAAAKANSATAQPMTPERKAEYAAGLAKYPGKRAAILAKYKEESKGQDYE